MGQARLPGEVVALLDGSDLDARVGFTLELLTVDHDGWPGVALLSAGEALALDDSTVRLALWPGTRTTANLTRTGQAALAFVDDGAAFTLRLETCRGSDLAEPALAVFDGRVVDVRRDEVSYARLRSGIVFDLPDPPSVVGRWRSTIGELRNHPGVRSLMRLLVGIPRGHRARSTASGCSKSSASSRTSRSHLVMSPAARETITLETPTTPRARSRSSPTPSTVLETSRRPRRAGRSGSTC